MSKSVQELLDLMVDTVWSKPGISSYGLLDTLTKRGYEYTPQGELSFESLISKLKSSSYIRYEKTTDKFYAYRAIYYPILLEGKGRRSSCYGCAFCKDTSELSTYDNEIEGKEFICSLNPLLPISRKVDRVSSKCPINEMLDGQNSLNVVPVGIKSLILGIMAIENAHTLSLSDLSDRLEYLHKRLKELEDTIGSMYIIASKIDPDAVARMVSQNEYILDLTDNKLHIHPNLDPARLSNTYPLSPELIEILSSYRA